MIVLMIKFFLVYMGSVELSLWYFCLNEFFNFLIVFLVFVCDLLFGVRRFWISWLEKCVNFFCCSLSFNFLFFNVVFFNKIFLYLFKLMCFWICKFFKRLVIFWIFLLCCLVSFFIFKWILFVYLIGNVFVVVFLVFLRR